MPLSIEKGFLSYYKYIKGDKSLATKIMRVILFILIGIVLLGILFYGVLYGIIYLIMNEEQGEYRNTIKE